MDKSKKGNGTQRGNPGRKKRSGIFYLLSFVFLAAAIILAGFLFYRNSASSYRTDVEQQLDAIVKMKVSELANWRHGRLNDALVFFKNDVFADLVRRSLAEPPDADARDQVLTWLGHFQKARQYERIMLLDNALIKKMIIPQGKERLVSYISLESLALLRSGRVVFEDLYWNEENRKIFLKILVPIPESRDGDKLLAVLAMRIDPNDYLYPLIRRWPTPSKTAETLLIRREGDNVLYLNDLKFRKNSALRLRLSVSQKDLPAVMALQGREGVVEGLDYRGVPVIAVIHAVPDSPWFLVARIDRREVFALLRERLRITIILLSILLLFSAVSLANLWRRQQVDFFKEQAGMAQELLDSQANLSAITNSAQDAILMMDDQGRLTFWNPAAERIFGHAAVDVLGRNLHDLIAPQRYHAAHHAAFPEFLRTGRGAAIGKTLELQGLRKDGHEITVSLSLSSVQVKGAWHAVGILRDISEQKNAEKAAARLAGKIAVGEPAARSRHAAGQPAGRRGPGGQHRQEPVPGQHEPRDPHAHERRHRHDRAAAGHRAVRGAAPLRRDGPLERRSPAERHQRHPGFLQDRGRQAGTGGASTSTCGPRSRTRRSCWPCAPTRRTWSSSAASIPTCRPSSGAIPAACARS